MIKALMARVGVANVNKLYMTATILCRALVGFSVYLILTRMLGPTNFGLMMTALSAATLAALITDFGFGWKVLRDIGAMPESGRDIFLEAVRFKVGMTVLVSAIGGVVIWNLPLTPAYKIATALFCLGTLINGIGDLGVVGYRATGRFKTETLAVLATSLTYAAAVLAVALLRPNDLIAVGAAFLFARTIYAVVAIAGPLRFLTTTVRRERAVTTTARDGVPWALDNALIVLLFQIDTMLLAHGGSLSDVGIYQAGGRLLEQLFQLSTVLSSVHVPLLARSRITGIHGYAIERRKMVVEFAGAGILVALGAAIGGPIFTKIYLGAEYSPLLHLWMGFAVLLFLRYVTSGLGAILTAAGHMKQRIIAQVAGVAATVGAFYAIFPSWGLAAMPWIMCIGVAVVAAFYVAFLALDEKQLRQAA